MMGDSRSTYSLIGYGDIAKRVHALLTDDDSQNGIVHTYSRSSIVHTESAKSTAVHHQIDIDSALPIQTQVSDTKLAYFVPPNNAGAKDLRTSNLLNALSKGLTFPQSVVLISTTGVYGDCDGKWVTEESETSASSERALRRLDAEQQWSSFCQQNKIPLTIFRVPGIYSKSRIPIDRLKLATPVLKVSESGFSNRVHAQDLARCILAAFDTTTEPGIYNISDGCPSTIAEYLQAAASECGLPPLAEVSWSEAKEIMSDGMLSYLAESRKISNEKMLKKLKVAPLYPDFRIGLRHF